MSQQEPGWFYIGNGQLQYKDSAGWTDQFQDLDSPRKVAEVETPKTPERTRSGVKKPRKTGKVRKVREARRADRELVPRKLLVLIKRGAGTAYGSTSILHSMVVSGWKLTATGYRKASAAASRRAIARRPRHRDSSSTSSVVRSQVRQALPGQRGGPTGHDSARVLCDTCGEAQGDVGSRCRACDASAQRS